MVSDKKKKENKNNWANIPVDMLELIMKRLSLKDYLGLRAICSTWRAIVSNAILNRHYCHPLPGLPLIFLRKSVFSLVTERELCLKSGVLKSKQICVGTVEGWLLLSEIVGVDSLSITFFNPITNATILVPQMLNYPHSNPDSFPLRQMVASSEPDSSSKSDCFLVGTFTGFRRLAFCKLNDGSWTIIEAENEVLFKEVEIIGSKLYVRASTNEFLKSLMLVYDMLQDSSNPPKLEVLAKLPRSPIPFRTEFGTQRTMYGVIRHFIAKDDASGELFLINMFCNVTYERQGQHGINEFVIPVNITSIEVYMLDTKQKETTKEWNKVQDLGDRVLFVSNCKSIVMSRTALNYSTKEVNIEGNSIYFALFIRCSSDPWGALQLGKICLTDNNINYFSVEKSNHRHVPYPYWFVPSV